jgi:hypothetical protein
VIALAIMVVASGMVSAAVPQKMSYQVMLTNDLGEPMSSQAVELVFTLYDEAGAQRWSEAHTESTNSIGVVSVVLGSDTPIDVDFSVPLWLGVQVNGSTLTPRRELVAAPYAFHAVDADRLGGAGASAYSLDGHDHDADYVNEGQGGSVTAGMLVPSVVSSVDGVSNHGGNIDLVPGSNVTITPDDGANTITISATPGGNGGDITAVFGDQGLTGEATSGDAHLSVGAGDGVEVSSDAVAVDVSDFAGGGLVDNGSNDLDVNTGTGLEISSDAVGLTLSYSEGSAYDSRFVNEGEPGSVTTAMVTPDLVSSVDGVSNDGGDIDLIAGSNISITPDDGSNTITIAATGGGDDGDWTQGGGNVYRESGAVGIGTATPDAKLDVESHEVIGARFTSDFTGDVTHVVHAEYTATGGHAAYAVYGQCIPADNWGHGGYFVGGLSGVEGRAYSTGPHEYTGVHGQAEGGSGVNIGVKGSAMASSGINCGVYGEAGGAGANYAGYFEGDVYVAGLAEVAGFEMSTDAVAGRVLTSDASGIGTWEAAPSPNSIDGVSNDAGDIDLVAGTNITITPDDGANTITIAATGGGDDGDWTQSGSNVYRATGAVGIGIDPPNASALHIHRAAQQNSHAQFTNSETGSGAEDGLWVGVSALGYPMIWDRTGGGIEFLSDSGGDAHLYSGGLDVSGYVTMDGFRMDTDPTPGLVLTATSEHGYGSWMSPAWFQSDSYAYREGGVGIGTTTPNRKLEVHAAQTVGVLFTSTNPSDTARVFHAEYEYSGPSDGVAVSGRSTPWDFYGYGGFFEGGYRGVQGQVTASGGYVYTGVYGAVAGGSGSNTNYGVRGYAYGPGTNRGVYGYADVDDAEDYAGYFAGPLYSETARTGVGGFRIDHPLNPEGEYLSHSSVESPDMKNVYDGVAVLDAAGEAWVVLPAWFEALNRDYRYQLTAIGAAGPDLHIAAEISGNRFQIAGGTPGMKVSWQVTGVRQDPLAEARRIQVEEPKSARSAGKYLNPEVYGLPESAGISYVEEKEKQRN